jgi:hypothetical protein
MDGANSTTDQRAVLVTGNTEVGWPKRVHTPTHYERTVRLADLRRPAVGCPPPQDPYGDGYIDTIATELHEQGMTASTVAEIEGIYADSATTLSGFVGGLAADWRGWNGIRTWTAMKRKLAIDAQHDGRGRVSLGVTLRAAGLDVDDTAWSARAVFVLEAGEEMTRFAAELTHVLGT